MINNDHKSALSLKWGSVWLWCMMTEERRCAAAVCVTDSHVTARGRRKGKLCFAFSRNNRVVAISGGSRSTLISLQLPQSRCKLIRGVLLQFRCFQQFQVWYFWMPPISCALNCFRCKAVTGVGVEYWNRYVLHAGAFRSIRTSVCCYLLADARAIALET